MQNDDLAGVLTLGRMTAIYVRLTDDGQFIRKWDRKPFDGATAFYADGFSPSLTEAAKAEAERDAAVAQAEAMERLLRCVPLYRLDAHMRDDIRAALTAHSPAAGNMVATTDPLADASEQGRGM